MTSIFRRTCLLILIMLSLNGCSTFNYYKQSIQGHMEVMKKSRAIEQVLNDNSVKQTDKTKLTNVLALLEFAEQELKLPNSGSYQEYADIGRPYVVWNVFATEEFSLTPIESCFLFVGCLSYRGYFAEEEARDHAQILKDQSYDVFLGGVAAYSTLGWFQDPVLNTMLRWDENYLNKVILHELAHQKLYIKGDSAFNEAFADAVALIGIKRWLRNKQDNSELQQYLQEQQYENQFIDLVLEYKNRLQSLYQNQLPDGLKRTEKKHLFNQLENDYQTLKQNWAGYSGFDGWFKESPNNAKISAVSTYRELVPGFLTLFQMTGEDIQQFYELVDKLSKCPKAERHKALKKQPQIWSC